MSIEIDPEKLRERPLPASAGSLPRQPWVASSQYGMKFILSLDNEILWRADWMPMEMLRAMVKAANEVQAENAELCEAKAP